MPPAKKPGTPTVAEYYAALPARERKALKTLRAQIRAAAPEATEVMSYGMPTFRGKRALIHIAAQANHLAAYASPGILDALGDAVKPYRKTKSALHFTPDAPLPARLVARIVKQALVDEAPPKKAPRQGKPLRNERVVGTGPVTVRRARG